MKGMKDNIVLGLVVLILAITVFQAFQISSLTGKVVGANPSATGGIDMSGWTEDEKMMYEHHGTLPTRLSAQQSSAGAQMVGGC